MIRDDEKSDDLDPNCLSINNIDKDEDDIIIYDINATEDWNNLN